MKSYMQAFSFLACKRGLEETGFKPFTRKPLLELAIVKQGNVVRCVNDGASGQALLQDLSSKVLTPLSTNGQTSTTESTLSSKVIARELWDASSKLKPRLGQCRTLYDNVSVTADDLAKAKGQARETLARIRDLAQAEKRAKTSELFKEIMLQKLNIQVAYKKKISALEAERDYKLSAQDRRVEDYHRSLEPAECFVQILEDKLDDNSSPKETVAVVLEKAKDLALAYELKEKDTVAACLAPKFSPLKEVPGYSLSPLKQVLKEKQEELLSVKTKKRKVDNNQLRAFSLINSSGTVEMSSEPFMNAIRNVHSQREKKAADKQQAKLRREAAAIATHTQNFDQLSRVIRYKLQSGNRVLVAELKPWLKASKAIQDKRTTKASEKLSIRLGKLLSLKGERFLEKTLNYARKALLDEKQEKDIENQNISGNATVQGPSPVVASISATPQTPT